MTKTPLIKAAAVHDLSGYGRASLTVVLPVMASLGVQVCPLPTALLSTQTTGFNSYHYRDLTDDMFAVLRHWQEISLQFDGIYSGFLGSSRQIACVEQLISTCSKPGALVVIDPVMGDDGDPYGPITDELISGMRQLVTSADIITPNFTEAALLLEEPYTHAAREPQVLQWLSRLLETGAKKVVITSVPVEGKEDSCMLYAADGEKLAFYRMETPRLAASYPGSGDMFTSILTASFLRHRKFLHAAALGAEFVSRAIQLAMEWSIPHREGLLIEPVLPQLWAGKTSFTWEQLEGPCC